MKIKEYKESISNLLVIDISGLQEAIVRSFLISISATLYLFSSEAAIKVGLVLDRGGKDDKSFNTAAYEGAKKAEKELGIELKYVEAQDLSGLENLHRNFAKKRYDLIIGIGFAQMDAVKKVASQNPDIHFAIVDAEIEANNIRSLMFEEHEGSYVVGAIAAKESKTQKIGFIGGMDIPLIRRFSRAYSAGAKATQANIKVIENYIGVTNEAWHNPSKAKELALAQYSAGVDIIFVAAGASASGAFDAAEEKKKYVIGVDSNQNWIKPGLVLTSMLKRVDLAVFDTIAMANQKQFKSGIVRFGLKNQGVDYAMDKYNEKLLSPDTLKLADQIKKQIIDGKIKVPDFYLEKQKVKK